MSRKSEANLLAKLRAKVFTGKELTEDQVEFIGIQYQRAIVQAKAKHLGSWDIKLWALSQVQPLTPKHVFLIMSRLKRDPEDFIWIKEELQKIHMDIMSEKTQNEVLRLQDQMDNLVSDIQLIQEKLEKSSDNASELNRDLVLKRESAKKMELLYDEAVAKLEEEKTKTSEVLFDSNRLNITVNFKEYEVVLTQKATEKMEEQVYIKKYHLQDLFEIKPVSEDDEFEEDGGN